jgi:hypothetical protein
MLPLRNDLSGHELTEKLLKKVKNRIRILLFVSTVTVALAFGLSFYFALISNESAMAKQIPELEIVANKLKSQLVFSTLAFIAVIIASFFVLSSLITSRMFKPLGFLHKNLSILAGGILPRGGEIESRGAFSSLNYAFKAALNTIHEKESEEIKRLEHCLKLLCEQSSSEVEQGIKEILKGKKAFLGTTEKEETGNYKEKETDTLFMQPG